jgi:hypothetical protein
VDEKSKNETEVRLLAGTGAIAKAAHERFANLLGEAKPLG